MDSGKGDAQGSAAERLKRFLETKPTHEALETWMKKLPPEEYVECALYMLHHSPTTFIRVLNQELGFKNADTLSDEELFGQLAKAIDDGLEIRNGKVGLVYPGTNPEPLSRFASLFNEAVRRGFQREEIYLGMRPYSETSSKFEPLEHGDRDWKRFEILVARIHIAFCREAQVRWSERLADSAGRLRQVDVTIRQKIGPHSILGIVECKHEKRPVSIEDVESFITKKSDLRANLAVMVSSSGYQEGAREKARIHDVRLWTLEEAEKASWRDEFRLTRLSYPFFDSIEIVPHLPGGVLKEGTRVSFDEVSFTDGVRRRSLTNLAGLAIHNAAERCLPVPCTLDMEFDKGARVEFAGHTFPVERVSFHFDRKIVVEQGRQIRVPAGATLRFSSASSAESFVVHESDLPNVQQQ